MPDHVVDTGAPGPTILVIGDSFTANYFPLMLSQHGGGRRSGSIIMNAGSTGS